MYSLYSLLLYISSGLNLNAEKKKRKRKKENPKNKTTIQKKLLWLVRVDVLLHLAYDSSYIGLFYWQLEIRFLRLCLCVRFYVVTKLILFRYNDSNERCCVFFYDCLLNLIWVNIKSLISKEASILSISSFISVPLFFYLYLSIYLSIYLIHFYLSIYPLSFTSFGCESMKRDNRSICLLIFSKLLGNTLPVAWQWMFTD